MKRYILNITLLFATFILSTATAWGVNWSGSMEGTYTLTENVTITGLVTVASGKTLTIDGNGKTIYIQTTTTSTAQPPISFAVYGTLIMNNVIIDGQNGSSGSIVFAEGTEGQSTPRSFTDFNKAGTPITAYNRAVVTLTNVTAKNLYANVKGGVAFLHVTTDATKDASTYTSTANRAKITLNSCKITNCLHHNDNGIIYQSNGSKDSKAVVTHGDFIIDNTVISHCMVAKEATGTGYGGVIKGPGSTDCNLTVRNGSKMSYCWGSGWGGAVLWAANLEKCIATFENSTFENNYARYLGGAISSEATIEVTNCTFTNNTAGYGGGAIAAFPFTLSQTVTDGVDNSTAVGLTLSGNTITNNKTLYKTNFNGANVPDDIRCKDSNGTPQSLTNQDNVSFNPRYTIANATDVTYPTGGGAIWVLMNKDRWNCNLSIGSNTISQNSSANNGGAIYLFKQTPYTSSSGTVTFSEDYSVVDGQRTGVTQMTLSATVSGNTAAVAGGGVAVGASTNSSPTWTFPNVTVSGGAITGNTATNGNGGGVYMPGGNFTVSGNSEISTNKAPTGNGGGVYVEDGELTVNAGQTYSLNGNIAKLGGAIYLEKGNINVSGTVNAGATTANTADNGGAIYVANGNFTIANGSFENNAASNYGGAIYVANGGFSIKDGTFTSNTAGSDGGGVYLGAGSFTVSGTTSIAKNVASSGNGGGVLCNGTFTVTSTGKLTIGGDAEADANTANSGNGGGVYCAGSFTVASGGDVKINHNTAQNGGGFCINNGAVTLPQGTVAYNSATQYGGGLYLTNAEATAKTATFAGAGTFDSNTAKAGGGIYADGPINLNLSANVKNNTAENGGGIYISGGVQMKFGNGLIVGNRAETTAAKPGTAYQKNAGDVSGVGGGIFMGSGQSDSRKTELRFREVIDPANASNDVFPDNMGIYNNVATWAAADIFANGANTLIELPDISGLNLKDFDVPGNQLYWVEDYVTYDTAYESGTEVGSGGFRYEDALKDTSLAINRLMYNSGTNDVQLGGETWKMKNISAYACLDLGYDYVFLHLIKKNLDNGDDATFVFSSKRDDDEDPATPDIWVPYTQVLFIGNGADVERIIGLPSGDWKIEESNWSYKYEALNQSSFTPVQPAKTDEFVFRVTRDGIGAEGASGSNLKKDTDGNVKLVVTNTHKEQIGGDGGSSPAVNIKNINEYNHRKVNILKPTTGN